MKQDRAKRSIIYTICQKKSTAMWKKRKESLEEREQFAGLKVIFVLNYEYFHLVLMQRKYETIRTELTLENRSKFKKLLISTKTKWRAIQNKKHKYRRLTKWKNLHRCTKKDQKTEWKMFFINSILDIK